MKHFFLILLTTLVGMQSVQGQRKTQTELEAEKMQQATFIFEGQLVSTDSYFNSDRSRVFRSSLIRVTRNVRGKLQTAAVQVVSKGPRGAATTTDSKTGQTLVQLPEETGHGNPDNQGITLPAGTTVLFFCKPLSASFTPRPAHTRDDALEIVGLAYDFFRNRTVVSDIGGKFPSQEALFRYLNTTYQLPLPAPERPLSPSQIDSAGRENHRQAELIDEWVRKIRAEKEKKAKQRNRSGAFAPQTTKELTFTIQSPTVTGTSTRYLEFDVFVQSSTSGGSYFSSANMEFSYNTAAFGNSLGTTGNVRFPIR